MKKPLIGITCNYDEREGWGASTGLIVAGQDGVYLASDYVYILEKAGATPVLLPQCSDFENLKPLLDLLDGILVSGGHDVGPERYNTFPKPYCGTVSYRRDTQDLAVTRYMLDRDKPLLGICRGIQILNVAQGGTLYQDLEKEGGFEHHFGDKYPRNVGWHKVSLAEGSLLRRAYGAEEISVNSFHHQAVRDPGTGVTISARSSDGVPEAIEVEGHTFAVGVQWHPEMMFDSSEQRKLLQAFVDACR